MADYESTAGDAGGGNVTSAHDGLTAQRARELLSYDAETGTMVWEARKQDDFPHRAREYLRWNKRYAGSSVGAVNPVDGYRYLKVESKSYSFHRLAWLMTYGSWPSQEIDHIDGDRANNRLSNLRCVPRSVNAKNKALRSDNTSGCSGVQWKPKNKKWQASIRCDNRLIYLGIYSNIDDAIAARNVAQSSLGFHPNHGRAA